MDGTRHIDTVDNIRIPPQMGPIEFMRRLRRDQLSVLSPEVYSRR